MSACGIDPTKRKHWVKVLPDVPVVYLPPSVTREEPPPVFPTTPARNRGEPPPVFPKTSARNRGEPPPVFRKTLTANRGEPPPVFPKTLTANRGEPPPVFPKTLTANRGEPPPVFPKTLTANRGEPPPVFPKTQAANRGEPPPVFPKTPAANRGEPPPVFPKNLTVNRGEPPPVFPKTPAANRGEPPPVFPKTRAAKRGDILPALRLPSLEADEATDVEPYGRFGSEADDSGRKPSIGEHSRLFGADDIQALDTCNFDEFITVKEKALIMFYNPCAPDTILTAKEFATASERPHPQNHAFASVDCSSEQELCCREKATRLPIFKLYSNGFEVSTIKFAKNFNADQMNMLIKMTPVLTGPKAIIGSL